MDILGQLLSMLVVLMHTLLFVLQARSHARNHYVSLSFYFVDLVRQFGPLYYAHLVNLLLKHQFLVIERADLVTPLLQLLFEFPLALE